MQAGGGFLLDPFFFTGWLEKHTPLPEPLHPVTPSPRHPVSWALPVRQHALGVAWVRAKGRPRGRPTRCQGDDAHDQTPATSRIASGLYSTNRWLIDVGAVEFLASNAHPRGAARLRFVKTRERRAPKRLACQRKNWRREWLIGAKCSNL